MMRRGLCPIVGAALLGGGLTFAQQVPPPRDTRPGPVAGNGVIAGRIVTGDPVQPLARAHVVLSGAELLGDRSVVTDATGVFRFERLPVGQFTLSASKPGYVSATYGGRRAGRMTSGVPISLTEGQRFEDISLTLHKGSVLTGRLTDARGRPLNGVEVSANRYERWGDAGERYAVGYGSATTDDRGIYRIYGLPSGEYSLRATVGWWPGSARVIPAGEIERALKDTRPAARPEGRLVAMAPVYYPGSSTAPGTTITVGSGEERTGLDIVMAPVPTSRIDGTVIGVDGNPTSQARVRLYGEGLWQQEFGAAASKDPSGAHNFSFAGIAPGRYVVVASAGAGSPGTELFFRSESGGSSVQSDAAVWAVAEIEVSGVDISGVTLRLQSGATVSGRIVFDGLDVSPIGALEVGLVPVSPGRMANVRPAPAKSGTDGRFTISNVVPGRYRLNALTPNPVDAQGRRWTLKSAHTTGGDAADVPMEVRLGADVTDLVVTFSDKATELTGMLQQPTGQAASEFFIVIFPADRSLWGAPRRARSVRPASDGRYRIAGMPPGDYLLAALTDVEQAEWLDPSFLEKLAPASVRVTLAEGEKKSQDLRLR